MVEHNTKPSGPAGTGTENNACRGGVGRRETEVGMGSEGTIEGITPRAYRDLGAG